MTTARTVALEVGRSCPRDCLYCYNHWKGPARPESDPEPGGADLTSVIDAALGSGRFVRADLTGGEPMALPDFFEILDRIRGHGVRPALVTDGGLVGPSEAKDLAARDLALVQPTILSADRAVHDRLKGAAGSLDSTIHAIALLLREGIDVCVTFICTRLNHDHLEEVLRLCRALGVPSLALARLCTTGEALAHRDELWPEPRMVRTCLAGLRDLGRRYKVRVHNAVAVPHCVWPEGGRCAMASGAPNFTVDQWGRVRPCSVSSVVLGRLPVDGWEAIEGRYRDGLLPQLAVAVPAECRGCEHLEACGGGCRESGHASTGSWEGLDPLAQPTTG